MLLAVLAESFGNHVNSLNFDLELSVIARDHHRRAPVAGE